MALETADPRDAMASPDVTLRAAAARALAAHGTQDDLALLVEAAKTDKSPSVRLYAAAAASDVAMRFRRELSEASRGILRDALKGYDPGKNPSLLLVLSALTEPFDLDRLGRLLRDPRSDVRAAAATALRRLALGGPVDGLQVAVGRWLEEGRHPPDAEAELVRLAGEIGWTSLEEALKGITFRATAATAARALALERLAARRDPASWQGLWVARATDTSEDIVGWISIDGGTVVTSRGVTGKFVLDGGEARLTKIGRAQRVWVPAVEATREGLRVDDGVYWREVGKPLAAVVEQLSDALADHPGVARALAVALEDVDGVGALRARARALWRAGSLDEAWELLAPLVTKSKAPRPELLLLAARVRLARGERAPATKLARAAMAAAPKKSQLRADAEGLVAEIAGRR